MYRNYEGYSDPTAGAALSKIAREEKAARGTRSGTKTGSGRKPLVYVCSPYAGNVEQNVKDAVRYCRHVIRRGCIPYAPHLLFPRLLNDDDPAERRLGLDFGLAMLYRCDELWVFGSRVSSGMKGEIDRALSLRRTVRWFSSECVEMPGLLNRYKQLGSLRP